MASVITSRIIKLLKQGGHLAGKNNQGKPVKLTNSRYGGIAVGAKHGPEGGIKGKVGTESKPIEFEGEEIIITAPAVKDSTALHDFDGQKLNNRQILSKINESGGGVSFADGGEIPGKIKYGKDKTFKVGSKVMTARQVVEYCGCGCEHSKMGKGGSTGKAEKYIVKNTTGFTDDTKSEATAVELIEYAAGQVKFNDKKEPVTIEAAIRYLRNNGHSVKKYFAEGEYASDSYEKLLADFKKIDSTKNYILKTYKNDPEELIRFVQEQATGFASDRKTVHGNAYHQSVEMVGADLVHRAVALMPQAEKDQLIKSWKGKIVPKALRDAVKTKLAEGGNLSEFNLPESDATIDGLRDMRNKIATSRLNVNVLSIIFNNNADFQTAKGFFESEKSNLSPFYYNDEFRSIDFEVKGSSDANVTEYVLLHELNQEGISGYRFKSSHEDNMKKGGSVSLQERLESYQPTTDEQKAFYETYIPRLKNISPQQPERWYLYQAFVNWNQRKKREAVTTDLALGGLLDHRARDYKLLQSTVDFPSNFFADGGEIANNCPAAVNIDNMAVSIRKKYLDDE